jgi:hypothetical protein
VYSHHRQQQLLWPYAYYGLLVLRACDNYRCANYTICRVFLTVAPSHLQLERRLLLNSGRSLRRRLLLAPGRWRLAFRFQLRQLELDGDYGFLNRLELVADALDGFLVTNRSVPSKRSLIILQSATQ